MKNGSVHIYFASSIRIEGKSTPRQIRKYIGILDQTINELLLGKSLNALTPEELQALNKQGITFSNRHVEHRERLVPLRRGEVIAETIMAGSSMEYGRALLLSNLAEQLKLRKTLESAFGKEISNSILQAAIYEVCTGGALSRMQDWIEGTILQDWEASSSPAAISRLCQHLGEDEQGRNQFFADWYVACGCPRSLVNDTTSISSYSERLTWLEWGHNRDLEALPQVNLNMVHARGINLPLMYRLIFGSIPDVSVIVQTVKIMQELGMKKYSLALDRGFFSNDNLWFFIDNNIAFTIGVPLNNAKLQRLINGAAARLKAFGSSMVAGSTTLNHTTANYLLTQNTGNGKQCKSRRITAHIYLNQKKRADEAEKLDAILHGILKEFHSSTFENKPEAEKWLFEKAGKNRSELFSLSHAGKGRPASSAVLSSNGKFRLAVAERSYAQFRKYLGYFVILNSDHNADGENTLLDNRSRDLQEKVFDIYKNATGNDRLHVSKDSSMHGRVFIAFVAVILWKTMENKLRAAELLGKLTVHSALDLAAKFNVMCLQDGKRLPLEVPKKSREVIEAIAPGLLSKYGIPLNGKKNVEMHPVTL